MHRLEFIGLLSYRHLQGLNRLLDFCKSLHGTASSRGSRQPLGIPAISGGGALKLSYVHFNAGAGG